MTLITRLVKYNARHWATRTLESKILPFSRDVNLSPELLYVAVSGRIFHYKSSVGYFIDQIKYEHLH
jgi:hypothetical protein